MAKFDAVFVGSGISSLVGAAIMCKAGWEVCVLERNRLLGGNICTEELTVPGFRHDVLSGWHPLFLARIMQEIRIRVDWGPEKMP